MPHFFTMEDVGRELGVSRPLVYRLMERVRVGRLDDRKRRMGGRRRWLFTREEVDLMQASRGPDGRPPRSAPADAAETHCPTCGALLSS